MSRSYRKPYSAITGCKSAKDDKRVARQALRRLENQRIRNCQDFELLCMPDRLDAAYNDVWSWGRDGKQTLQFPPRLTLRTLWWWTEQQELDWYERQLRNYKRLFRK